MVAAVPEIVWSESDRAKKANSSRNTVPVDHMAATYQVVPPEAFNFNRPEERTKWIRRFERFRKASGLETKDEEAQVNTLIYTMGDKGDDILRSFNLSEAEKYDTVKEKFDSHFVKRRNVIYERAKFNMRKQEEGETRETHLLQLSMP